MLNISVNLKDTKKLDLIYFGKLRRFQSFFDALYVIYELSDIKDDIGAPCILYNLLMQPFIFPPVCSIHVDTAHRNKQ